MELNFEYIPRIVDKEIDDKMHTFGAVSVRGPKSCGKTSACKRYAASSIDFGDPDTLAAYLETVNVKPSLLLRGPKPLLIDEWQEAPVMWDAVKTAVDKSGGKVGQYLLTGSSSHGADKTLHPGTNRIDTVDMGTMSLFESGESNGKIALISLFSPSASIDGIRSELSIEQLVFSACRGGWPESLPLADRYALGVAGGFVRATVERDISRVDGITRDKDLGLAILKSYSRNLSTMASDKTIMKDADSNSVMSSSTYYSYLKALSSLFVTYEIPAWSPPIRSAFSLRSAPKRELCDPSVMVASLGLTPEILMNDLKTFGFIFENLCARDLKVYSSAVGGRLLHYHDRNGLEADFVLRLSDGRYALIECKLGSQGIIEGSKHLTEIKTLIAKYNDEETKEENKIRLPDALIVLTGGPLAYKDGEGVFIVPIGSLR